MASVISELGLLVGFGIGFLLVGHLLEMLRLHRLIRPRQVARSPEGLFFAT
jgi:hypothetical protein